MAKEVENGITVVAVEGKIVGKSARSIEVPQLRFAARNAQGREVYIWTPLVRVEPSSRPLKHWKPCQPNSPLFSVPGFARQARWRTRHNAVKRWRNRGNRRARAPARNQH